VLLEGTSTLRPSQAPGWLTDHLAPCPHPTKQDQGGHR